MDAALDAIAAAPDEQSMLERLVELCVDAETDSVVLVQSLLRRQWQDHQSWEVRARVASQLMFVVEDDPGQYLDPLIRLTIDPHPRVRDWATFSLAQCGFDGPEVREALALRLEDDDDEARGEALRGLALRADRRATEHLRSRVDLDVIFGQELRAAAMVADPALHDWLSSWEEDYVGDSDEEAWRLARDRCAPEAPAQAAAREKQLLDGVRDELQGEAVAELVGSYPCTQLVVTWPDGGSWDGPVWPDATEISWASYEAPGSIRWRGR